MIIPLKYFYESLNILVILAPASSLANVPNSPYHSQIKSNDGHLSFGTVIVHFEINPINK